MNQSTVHQLARRATPHTPLSMREQIESFLEVKLPQGYTIGEAEAPLFLGQSDIDARILERPPFMWVDRVVSVQCEGEKTIVWGRAIMAKEQSEGHFPGRPIVPLLHLCKAIAQTGIIASALQGKEDQAPIGVHSGESNATAKDLIDAPATVLTKCVVEKFRMRICFLNGSVYHDGEEVGTLADMRYLLLPKSQILLHN